MISKLIVFSTLVLAVIFTVLYIVRPEFRARIEKPKTTFLQQLSMYDNAIGLDQPEADTHFENNSRDSAEVEAK